jgi:hypothetical protein
LHSASLSIPPRQQFVDPVDLVVGKSRTPAILLSELSSPAISASTSRGAMASSGRSTILRHDPGLGTMRAATGIWATEDAHQPTGSWSSTPHALVGEYRIKRRYLSQPFGYRQSLAFCECVILRSTYNSHVCTQSPDPINFCRRNQFRHADHGSNSALFGRKRNATSMITGRTAGYATQPILAEMDSIAAHCDVCSPA